jgi:hypothetical protein
MGAVAQIPDLEQIAGDFLRDHPDIQPLARVSGTLPKSFASAWVKVTQLDARPETTFTTDHLISYLLQLDCYAGSEPEGGQAQAATLARAVRAAIHQLAGQTLDGAAVGRVQITADARIPDTSFAPPRERRIVTVEIYAHAA